MKPKFAFLSLWIRLKTFYMAQSHLHFFCFSLFLLLHDHFLGLLAFSIFKSFSCIGDSNHDTSWNYFSHFVISFDPIAGISACNGLLECNQVYQIFFPYCFCTLSWGCKCFLLPPGYRAGTLAVHSKVAITTCLLEASTVKLHPSPLQWSLHFKENTQMLKFHCKTQICSGDVTQY